MPSAPTSRPRTRTYLIDPRFQLKYTALLVGVVALVLAVLGSVVFRTASGAAASALLASGQAERALRESAKVSKFTLTSAAANAPEDVALQKQLELDLAELDKDLQRNLNEVNERRAEVDRQRIRVLYLMLGGGVTLLLVLTVLGIFITHRIVGPVHKLKRMIRQVGTARLVVKEKLRKGDELEDLFDTFVQMTYSLKALQSGRLATLEVTMRKAEALGVPDEVDKGLRALKAQLKLGLGGVESMRLSSVAPPPIVSGVSS